MKDKIQLNTRVRKPFRDAAKFSAGVIGVSVDDLGEIMVRILVGEEDAKTKEARHRVAKAWRAVGDKLPSFNTLCAESAEHQQLAA